MSREQFEQLVTVPEWVAFDPVHGYSNPEWQDLDPATNFVRLDELSRINTAWKAYQSRQSEIDALHARIAELEADAKRWHFVRQFMCLDDVGDEDFCLGLIIYGESLSERVDPAASRLYKDRWDARCRAEYQGEELDQGEITVDEAIDAAMQEGEA